jgi:hypothetical protein
MKRIPRRATTVIRRTGGTALRGQQTSVIKVGPMNKAQVDPMTNPGLHVPLAQFPLQLRRPDSPRRDVP